MSDNVKINPATKKGAINVATDNVDEVHYPLYKLAIGDDGEASLVSVTNALPVSLPALTHETDTVMVLNEISRKLSILIEYEAMLHKVKLEDEM